MHTVPSRAIVTSTRGIDPWSRPADPYPVKNGILPAGFVPLLSRCQKSSLTDPRVKVNEANIKSRKTFHLSGFDFRKHILTK